MKSCYKNNSYKLAWKFYSGKLLYLYIIKHTVLKMQMGLKTIKLFLAHIVVLLITVL